MECKNCGCKMFKEDGRWMHSQCDIEDDNADIRDGYCECGCRKPETIHKKGENGKN